MSAQHHLTALKLLVILLGIVLVGGTVLLGSAVWKKVSLMRNADMLSAEECPGGQIDLKGRGIIIESRTDEQILRLTLEKKPGYDEILTIDTCTGRIVGSLILETDPGMPARE